MHEPPQTTTRASPCSPLERTAVGYGWPWKNSMSLPVCLWQTDGCAEGRFQVEEVLGTPSRRLCYIHEEHKSSEFCILLPIERRRLTSRDGILSLSNTCSDMRRNAAVCPRMHQTQPRVAGEIKCRLFGSIKLCSLKSMPIDLRLDTNKLH